MWRTSFGFVCGVLGFLGVVVLVALWGSQWADRDPCTISAPMEQAHCRAVGPRGPVMKSFLTVSRIRGKGADRNYRFRKGG